MAGEVASAVGIGSGDGDEIDASVAGSRPRLGKTTTTNCGSAAREDKVLDSLQHRSLLHFLLRAPICGSGKPIDPASPIVLFVLPVAALVCMII